MTVAAIVLVPDTAAALGDADGEPRFVAWFLRPGRAGSSDRPRRPGGVPSLSPTPLPTCPSRSRTRLPESPRDRLVRVWAARRRAGGCRDDGRAAVAVPHAWIDPETATSSSRPTASRRTPSFGRLTRPGRLPILLPTSLTERLAAHGGLHGQRPWLRSSPRAPPPGCSNWATRIVYDISAIRSSLPDYQGRLSRSGFAT